MREFQTMELREAEAHAAEGGQALHLHKIIVDRDRAPLVFVRAVDRGEWIAHLFDNDVVRLRRTARQLGVRVVYIDREGRPGQHLDLVGKPLQLARALCREPEPLPLFGG